MKKEPPLCYSESDSGSENLPLSESTRNDEITLLNDLDSDPVYLYNCKCICNKECFCGKTYVKAKHKKRVDYISKERSCPKIRICICCQKLNKPCLIFWLILFSIGILFCFFFMEQVVQNLVESQLVLKDGSKRFNDWKSGEPPVYYIVRVFNITNGRDFMRGARPLLREAGPYVYKMRERKEQISFNENGTVTFSPYPVFKFIPELSSGSEDDVITTLNVPLVNAGVQVEGNALMENILKIASRVHNFKSLQYLTVSQLLWGHKSNVLDWARKFKEVPYPYKHFGLMAGKNSTFQKSYTVYTGTSDISKIQEVNLYGGKSFLGAWGQTVCDQIHGSMIGTFHPRILPTETLHIFTGQLCRSLPLVFEKNVTHSGLVAYRFIPPPDTFSYGRENPSNQCYCKDDKCPPQGVLDVRSCYYGAAIAFSFPHFYQGDPTLRHIVRGLRPDPELHGTQFDIYPALGVPVRVKLRMQMNVVIDGNQALQRDRHFDVVFPVFWFEAGIDSLPGEMVGMLKMAQDLPSLVKTTSVTICAALSAIFFILVIASAFAGYCGMTPESSRTQTPDHLPDTHWPANHPHPILNSSGYTAGSLASLGPDDSYRNVLPPYRKTFYQAEEIDGCPPSAYDTLQSEDRPPAYTSAQNTTKASSSSLLSVEIHKSASLHTLDAPSTPTDLLVDDFTLPDKNRDILDSKEKYFEAEKLQGSSPSSPTIKNEFVLSSSAKSSHIDLPMDDSINISNFNDDTANPLITSSPSDSPSIITPTSSSAPTILTEVNTSSVSAPAILSEANYFSSSTDLREIHFPNAPAILAEEDTVPCDSSRPPPLESDL